MFLGVILLSLSESNPRSFLVFGCGIFLGVCDTVKVQTVIVRDPPSHRGNFPIKSGEP